MSIREDLRSARIERVLIVDDDLNLSVSLADLDATGERPLPSDVLGSSDHEITESLDAALKARDIAHATAEERAAALANDEVRGVADPLLRKAYEVAQKKRQRANAPLSQILGWFKDEFGIQPETWDAPRVLDGATRYDLLIVDYYLVDEKFDATERMINAFRAAHTDEARPLLVILMSSNIEQLRSQFEQIRDGCGMSAVRFKILAKPGAPGIDPAIDKEKWARALSTLAKERHLVFEIESFVGAWEKSLQQAASIVSRRMLDLDASAIGMLMATAKQDNMTFEEYFCDVVSRRISAESETNSFPIEASVALATKFKDKGPDVALDQGVEVRHGQRAIRALMCDVLWHRQEWWRPQDPVPEVPAVTVGDAESETAAEAARVERYRWMKRNLRFGTIIRNGAGEILINITQACDVQSVAFEKADQVNFLFLRGEKFAVDKVTEGEKSYDTPFFSDDPHSDQFFTLQWQLRRPVTPSLKETFEHLNDYSIVGQLRMDAAYAVLSKFVSQATRVALVRLPTLYECSVDLFYRPAQGQPWARQELPELSATVWHRKDKDWRVQFSVDVSAALLSAMTELQGEGPGRVRAVFANSVKAEAAERGEYHGQRVASGAVLLVRMDGRTTYDESKAVKFFSNPSHAFDGKYAILVRGTPTVD